MDYKDEQTGDRHNDSENEIDDSVIYKGSIF